LQRLAAVWMSVDSGNLIFNDVLNRIHEADVAETPALRLNWRVRFGTVLVHLWASSRLLEMLPEVPNDEADCP
jgi:hypothetical protein